MDANKIEISRSDKLVTLGLDAKLPKSQINNSALNLLYEIHIINKKRDRW